MNQIFRTLPILFPLLLGMSSSAFGQKTFAIALGGGVAIPVGKLADAQNTGPSALAALAIGVADSPLGVRFDGIYNNLVRGAEAVPAQGSSVSTANFRVMGVLANLVFAFPGTSAKSYVLVGGGLYNSKVEPNEKSQNNFGFNAGLGATFGVGPFATFIESRYHTISRKTNKGGVYQFVPITFGVMF
jgi:hypothetical protein